MRKNQQLVIVLPESSEELPIRIVRGSRNDISTKLVRKGRMFLSGDDSVQTGCKSYLLFEIFVSWLEKCGIIKSIALRKCFIIRLFIPLP